MKGMTMPTKKRRISLCVDDHVFAVLSLDRMKHGATQISMALSRYAEHVHRAGRHIEAILDRDEWNAIADVCNGCADLWDYSGTSYLIMIQANVEDGHELDGLGYKWFGDGSVGDERIKNMLRKLDGMTNIEGDAIAAAVRYFWTHCHEIDHARDEWWMLAYRLTCPTSEKQMGGCSS
jgi:hypothetical protein